MDLMKIYSKDIYDGKNTSFIKEYLTKKYKTCQQGSSVSDIIG